MPIAAHKTIRGFLDSEIFSEEPAEVHEAVTRYLSRYGIYDRDGFADRVRLLFDESQRHYDRLMFRNAVAVYWNEQGKLAGRGRAAGYRKLDMDKRGDRDELCRRIATERGLSRKMRLQWESGEADASPDHIKLYLYSIPDAGSRLPIDDNPIPPVRMGIARTLTYVRVLPPKVLLGLRDHAEIRAKSLDVLRQLPEADAIPEDNIIRCWKMLKDHAHFKSHKGELNQHALDEVRDEFRNFQPGDSLWIEPERIGDLKAGIETEAYSRLWFWPWVIFKYSTLANIQSTNRPTRNPHRWIWNVRHPRHAELWRRSNEV